jgi:hypothetical protein
LERDEALAELSRRYFVSRGPATVHDYAKWSGLTITDCRKGLEAVKDDLEHESMEGRDYWFAASQASLTENSSTTAHLLPIYDEYVSGYRDRSPIVSRSNGARLRAMGNALSGILVVDGQIIGVWKRTFDKNVVRVRLESFARLKRVATSAVDAAVERYGQFLGMSSSWGQNPP